MHTLSKYLPHACLLLALPSLAGAAFNEREPILCAIRDVNECSADHKCAKVTTESVALPDFFEIDLSKKLIASVGPVDRGTSPIERVERLNGKLILQGGDASGDNPRSGVGWTLTIDEDDGKLSIAGVGTDFALVAFGSCVQR